MLTQNSLLLYTQKPSTVQQRVESKEKKKTKETQKLFVIVCDYKYAHHQPMRSTSALTTPPTDDYYTFIMDTTLH